MGKDKQALLFKTRLRDGSRQKVNFAGHYILTAWGCGSACEQFMIIDARTGRVFHPKGVGSNSSVNVHEALMRGTTTWPTEGSIKHQLNSKLLVIFGAPEEDDARRGISYYVWEGERLKLIRHVAKPMGHAAGGKSE